MKAKRRERRAGRKIELAAGGLVWAKIAGRLRVAVIHRRKYGDWTLPKGRLKKGEEVADAAVREVKEELSGCVRPRLGPLAGVTWYEKAGRPKAVFFWTMTTKAEPEAFTPNREVNELRWVSGREAQRLLTHAAERELVRRACRGRGRP